MATYEVTDNRTGKKVTFDWHDEKNMPTDDDLEEVFASAGLRAEPEKTTGQKIAAAASPYVRPLFEAGGAIAGGSLGAGAGTFVAPGPGNVAGGIAGAGIGYAAGREIADRLDEYAGTKQRKDFPWQLVDAGKNVVAGAAMEGAGQAAGVLLPMMGRQAAKLSRPVMRSAVKPSTTDRMEITDQAMDTLIKYGITPTRKGLAKARSFLDEILGARNAVVGDMPQTKTVTRTVPGQTTTEMIPGQTVVSSESKWNAPYREIYHEKGNVGNDPTWFMSNYPENRLEQWRRMFKQTQPKAAQTITTTTPDAMLSQEIGTVSMSDVVKFADDAKALYSDLPPEEAAPFLDEIAAVQQKYLSGGENITPIQAEKMKEAIYRLVKKHYEGMTHIKPGETQAGVQARMDIARGLKDSLEQMDPTVGFYNQKLSDLLRASQYLERGMGRIGNIDPIGLTDTIFAAPAVALSNPVAGLGMAAANRALRSAPVRGKAALSLAKLAKVRGLPISSRVFALSMLRPGDAESR